MISMTIKELTKRIQEGLIILRETSQPHVRSIKRYIFENVQNGEVYFPPLVAHLDDGILENGITGVMTIIDGSHRLKAFVQLEEMMHKAINSDNEDEIKGGYNLLYLFENTKLALQIFEGFTSEEKDQLYIDLNSKGKKVSLSKRISYDSRNHINQITNHVLQLNENLQIAGVEMEKTAIIRPSNKNLLSLTQLRQIVGIFLTGKIMRSTEELTLKLPLHSHEYINLINRWFDELFVIFPPKMVGDYHESMLAGYPLLVSVAIYVNKGKTEYSYDKREKAMMDRMTKLKKVNFRRDNKHWEQFPGVTKGKENYFYLANNKKTISQLVNWLEQQGR